MAIRSKSVLSLPVRSLWAAALALAASCFIPTNTAMASVITYLVTGSVTNIVNVNGALPMDAVNTPIGAAFTLEYMVDTSVSPIASSTSTLAGYNGAITQASFQVAGGPSLQSSVNSLEIFADYFSSANNDYQTSYAFNTGLGNTSSLTGTVVQGAFGQFLTQSAPLGFFSTALAIPEPLPSSLQPNESIQLIYSSYVNGILSQDQYGAIIGNITSIQPVPITAAGWLLLSGLGIFWLTPQLRTARHRPGY